MKIAIVIHGNVRTFFMPLREASNIRVCDLALDRVILPNITQSTDVFIATDCNDFYYDGFQYFNQDKVIEINNADPFRLYPKIKFETNEKCREILETQLRNTIPNIKEILVENPYDCRQDSNYESLVNLNTQRGFDGATPSLLIGQYRKLNILYEMICRHESISQSKYDVIIKIRFDNLYPQPNRMFISNYDINDTVIYVPDSKAKFVYDWMAFGSRKTMEPYLTLYKKLGFTANYPSWLLEHCSRCGILGNDGILKDDKPRTGWRDVCPICGTRGKIWVADVTLSSEHHLFKTYELLNIKVLPIRSVYPLVYRYQDLQQNISLDSILESNKTKLSGAILLDNCMFKHTKKEL